MVRPPFRHTASRSHRAPLREFRHVFPITTNFLRILQEYSGRDPPHSLRGSLVTATYKTPVYDHGGRYFVFVLLTGSLPFVCVSCALFSEEMTVTTAPSPDSRPTRLVFPDLIAAFPYPLRVNRHGQRVSEESKQWLLAGCQLSKKRRAAFDGLKGGLLTAECYPLVDYDQLRVCCDFINYLFNLDDICEKMDSERAAITANELIGALRNPHDFRPTSAVGTLTQW